MPGTSCFVTICTRDRASGLAATDVAKAIETELMTMQKKEAFDARAWVIMPGHLHLFFRLIDTLTLSQVIGRLKSKTRSCLLAQQLA